MRPLIPTPTPAPCTLREWRPSIRTSLPATPRPPSPPRSPPLTARGPHAAAEGRRARGRSRDLPRPARRGLRARPHDQRWRGQPRAGGPRARAVSRSRTSSSPRAATDWTWTCTRLRHSAGRTASGTRSPPTPSPWTRPDRPVSSPSIARPMAGMWDALVFLLEAGADPCVTAENASAPTPLHSAVAGMTNLGTDRRGLEVLRLLLASGADPCARMSGGWTPAAAAENANSTEAARRSRGRSDRRGAPLGGALTVHGDEHHCDGVWIDLDVVLGAAGEGQLDEAARVAASFGATGLIGDAASLERTLGHPRVPGHARPRRAGGARAVGPGARRRPHPAGRGVGLVFVHRGSARAVRGGDSAHRPRGHAPIGGGADTVAGIWCEDAEARSPGTRAPPMAGRDSTGARVRHRVPRRRRRPRRTDSVLHPALAGAPRTPSAPTWRELTIGAAPREVDRDVPAPRVPERRSGEGEMERAAIGIGGGSDLARLTSAGGGSSSGDSSSTWRPLSTSRASPRS